MNDRLKKARSVEEMTGVSVPEVIAAVGLLNIFFGRHKRLGDILDKFDTAEEVQPLVDAINTLLNI